MPCIARLRAKGIAPSCLARTPPRPLVRSTETSGAWSNPGAAAAQPAARLPPLSRSTTDEAAGPLTGGHRAVAQALAASLSTGALHAPAPAARHSSSGGWAALGLPSGPGVPLADFRIDPARNVNKYAASWGLGGGASGGAATGVAAAAAADAAAAAARAAVMAAAAAPQMYTEAWQPPPSPPASRRASTAGAAGGAAAGAAPASPAQQAGGLRGAAAAAAAAQAAAAAFAPAPEGPGEAGAGPYTLDRRSTTGTFLSTQSSFRSAPTTDGGASLYAHISDVEGGGDGGAAAPALFRLPQPLPLPAQRAAGYFQPGAAAAAAAGFQPQGRAPHRYGAAPYPTQYSGPAAAGAARPVVTAVDLARRASHQRRTASFEGAPSELLGWEPSWGGGGGELAAPGPVLGYGAGSRPRPRWQAQ
jgi:hypothetical protein